MDQPSDHAALPSARAQARPSASQPAQPSGLASVRPELLIVSAALSVQAGAAIARQLLFDHGALPVVAMRIAFSALFLIAIRRPRFRGASREALASALALGVILATMNSLFYLAISRIPLGVAVTIEFWGPLAVGVIGSRRVRDLLWVALAAVGIFILAGGRLSADDMLGVAGALGAGACWALYIPTGGWMGRQWPDGSGLTIAMLVASAIVLPLAFASSGVGSLATDLGALGGGLMIALLSSTIPYSLEIVALRRLPSSVFGVLMSLEPAIAALVGFAFLGQVLAGPDVAAIVLVALASAGASLGARELVPVPGELEGA